MEWQVQHIGIDRSEALTRFAERRVIQPLARMADRVRHVLVRLKAGDGRSSDRSRGAAVQVSLDNGQVVCINAWAGCHYGAVDAAAERTKRTVARRVQRQHRRQRRTRARSPE